jgi:hypothetical protein
MQIREPKFKVGEKVYCEEYKCNAIIICISDYSFANDEYYYSLRYDDCNNGKMIESMLRPYQETPKTIWDLKKDDTYYLIDSDGKVLDKTLDNNLYIDDNCREIGNVFLTKEEAFADLERRKIETEMLRLGGRRNFKFNGKNYFIYYNDGINVKGINVGFYIYIMHQGLIYFDSKEQLNEVVKTIGLDRIKKYIFGVES